MTYLPIATLPSPPILSDAILHCQHRYAFVVVICKYHSQIVNIRATISNNAHIKTVKSLSIDLATPEVASRGATLAINRASKLLKLAELEHEWDEVEQQKKDLEAREQRLTRQKLAVVRGVPLDVVGDHMSYPSTVRW